MAIGTPAGSTNNVGTTTSATVTVTLPTITVDGYGVVLVNFNSSSSTADTPAGWTQIATSDAGTNCRAVLYGKATTSADSGATFTANLSAGTARRWAVASMHVPGASGLDVTAAFTETTNDATLSVAAITPGVADALRAVVIGFNSASAITAVTPPAGWTEYADTCSTHGTANWTGAWIGGVQLTGQNGVSQGSTTATYTGGTAKNSGWELTFTPAAAPAVGSSTGGLAWVGTAAGSFVAAGVAAGTLVFAGVTAGSTTNTGTATGTVAWTGAAEGSPASAGASSGSLTWVGVADGSAAAIGATTGALVWDGTATGTSASSGSSAGSLSWVGAATGEQTLPATDVTILSVVEVRRTVTVTQVRGLAWVGTGFGEGRFGQGGFGDNGAPDVVVGSVVEVHRTFTVTEAP